MAAGSLGSAAQWAPRGVLVAHLAEHRRAVNRVAVARNGAFFVTASSDETCKVWDSRRLEKDVAFRSKLTYASQVGCAAWHVPTALSWGALVVMQTDSDHTARRHMPVWCGVCALLFRPHGSAYTSK